MDLYIYPLTYCAKQRFLDRTDVLYERSIRSQSDRCQTCESIGRSFTRLATNRRRNPVSGSSR